MKKKSTENKSLNEIFYPKTQENDFYMRANPINKIGQTSTSTAKSNTMISIKKEHTKNIIPDEFKQEIILNTSFENKRIGGFQEHYHPNYHSFNYDNFNRAENKNQKSTNPNLNKMKLNSIETSLNQNSNQYYPLQAQLNKMSSHPPNPNLFQLKDKKNIVNSVISENKYEFENPINGYFKTVDEALKASNLQMMPNTNFMNTKLLSSSNFKIKNPNEIMDNLIKQNQKFFVGPNNRPKSLNYIQINTEDYKTLHEEFFQLMKNGKDKEIMSNTSNKEMIFQYCCEILLQIENNKDRFLKNDPLLLEYLRNLFLTSFEYQRQKNERMNILSVQKNEEINIEAINNNLNEKNIKEEEKKMPIYENTLSSPAFK